VDARAALLAGTGTAVALAVAMTCGVALSSASALADKPGTVLRGTAVVVPGSPQPTTTSSAADGAPETVAAPAPKDIGETHDDVAAPKKTVSAGGGTETKAGSGSSDAAKTAAEKKASTADTAKAGKTDDKGSSDVRHADGTAAWSADDAAQFRERMRALVERWERRQAEIGTRANEWREQQTQKESSVGTTEEDSGSVHPRDRSGLQKGQSHRSPDDRD